jgi:hypothetical protein
MRQHRAVTTQEISMTAMVGKQTLIALSAALVLGVAGASVAQASDNNSGDYKGGFVMPGSMDGVNPALHPGWFGPHARQVTTGYGAYGFADQKKSKYLESR